MVQEYISMIHTQHIPHHVGIILDGNRRWAKERGLKALEGHQKGAEVFREVALAAFDKGVSYLSAFIFSNENWSRTEEEVSYLMKLLMKAVERYLDDFHKRGIKIIVIGRREKISKDVLKAIEKTENKTQHNQHGCLVICFNYGGHQEIVDAVNKILVNNSDIKTVSSALIEQNLYAPEVPPLDLLIRTSGEQRISGFMLWRADYAELYFSDLLWPDYNVVAFNEALHEFTKRQRRFGG